MRISGKNFLNRLPICCVTITAIHLAEPAWIVTISAVRSVAENESPFFQRAFSFSKVNCLWKDAAARFITYNTHSLLCCSTFFHRHRWPLLLFEIYLTCRPRSFFIKAHNIIRRAKSISLLGKKLNKTARVREISARVYKKSPPRLCLCIIFQLLTAC